MKTKIFTIIFLTFFIIFAVDYSKYDLVYGYNYNKSYSIAVQKYKWINKALYNKIDKYAYKNNINTLLVCALIQRESHGKQYAKSCKGAKGLMQLMPVHYRDKKNKAIVYDVDFNLKRGTKHLKWMIDKSKRNLQNALIMYNQGHNKDLKEFTNWNYVNDIKNDFKDSLLKREIRR